MKTCKKCGLTFPVSNFYKHDQMADGRLNFCKTCVRERVGQHRLKNIEKVQQYDRDRFKEPKRRAYVYERMKKYREKNPEKNKARTAVGNAIRDGKLKRLPCAICGETRTEAHHDDYSKPLEVRWLCFKCHRSHAHDQVVTSGFNGKTRTPSLVDPPENV